MHSLAVDLQGKSEGNINTGRCHGTHLGYTLTSKITMNPTNDASVLAYETA